MSDLIALTDETPHNTDHLITGPQALTYGVAATIIGDAPDRRVQHTQISEAEVAWPQNLADFARASFAAWQKSA